MASSGRASGVGVSQGGAGRGGEDHGGADTGGAGRGGGDRRPGAGADQGSLAGLAGLASPADQGSPEGLDFREPLAVRASLAPQDRPEAQGAPPIPERAN